jgi:stage II sporulation protein AA (anti-sigma F factor antagonist)
MTGLTVVRRNEGEIGFLSLKGEARVEVVHRLDDAAQKALDEGARHLLMDCSRLTFMDSASAGSFIRIERDLTSHGGTLVLYGLPRVVQRLFDAAGLADRFQTANDEATARALLPERPGPAV